MKVIGIIGGIGAGKSTVVALINEIVPSKVISADIIGHDILKKGNKAYEPIIEAFGTEILNLKGEIERKKLGSIVFNSKELISKLNAITHPIITNEIRELIDKYRITDPSKYIILEAALLIESGLISLTDVVIGVRAEVSNRTKRVSHRDNLSDEQIMLRIKAQKEWSEMEKYADYIIDNNNGLECTKNRVSEILELLKEGEV